ncbi:hypothetical protein DPMN_179670 [Dreissena polymorpha]|uniref:Uncharacterized protein n=1 Tax=Dreissena polymorpha TaxID=45954 RepID=A0A9D4EEF6_DREPO|nr:hypothetical protein DPMN_179670 [Dreissena polymorpha]
MSSMVRLGSLFQNKCFIKGLEHSEVSLPVFPLAVLSWALYYLAQYPDIQERVYAEIRRVLGEQGNVDHTNVGEFQYVVYSVIIVTKRLCSHEALVVIRSVA